MIVKIKKKPQLPKDEEDIEWESSIPKVIVIQPKPQEPLQLNIKEKPKAEELKLDQAGEDLILKEVKDEEEAEKK